MVGKVFESCVIGPEFLQINKDSTKICQEVEIIEIFLILLFSQALRNVIIVHPTKSMTDFPAQLG